MFLPVASALLYPVDQLTSDERRIKAHLFVKNAPVSDSAVLFMYMMVPDVDMMKTASNNVSNSANKAESCADTNYSEVNT